MGGRWTGRSSSVLGAVPGAHPNKVTQQTDDGRAGSLMLSDYNGTSAKKELRGSRPDSVLLCDPR